VADASEAFPDGDIEIVFEDDGTLEEAEDEGERTETEDTAAVAEAGGAATNAEAAHERRQQRELLPQDHPCPILKHLRHPCPPPGSPRWP